MKITTHYQKPAGVWRKKKTTVFFWEKEYWKHKYNLTWTMYQYYKNVIIDKLDSE